jgi:glycosidase
MGGDAGLIQFRERLHQRGMKLILDFVPNHLGLDHVWLRSRPGLFVQAPQNVPGTFLQQTNSGDRWLAHGKDPFFSPWTDTVQIDYRLANTRKAMTELLVAIADRCDGVRCDMAMLLLDDVFARTWDHFPIAEPKPETPFWSEAVGCVRAKYPDFLFLAEVYWGLESVLQSQGFDFTYDKVLYDVLLSRNTGGVHYHLMGMLPQHIAKSAHFLENHDEHRVGATLGLEEQRAAALLILGLPGLRLLHEGQLEGARLKIPVQLARRAAEERRPEIEAMYETLLETLKRTSIGKGNVALPRLRQGWPENPTAQNMFVVQWQQKPDEF